MGLLGFGKPWLKRNYRLAIFRMKVSYVIKHLGMFDKKKIFSSSGWQQLKENKVLLQLKEGANPKSFDPIRIVLHEKKEEFRVEDGISKLRAFKKKKINKIYAEVRVGDW